MKDEIERRLRPLIGEPLTDMYRFARIQVFEFGIQQPSTNRRGEPITVADQELHISSQWSLHGPIGQILASDDFGPGKIRRDEGAQPFYDALKIAPSTVQSIAVALGGGVKLHMSDGYCLAIEPVSQPAEPEESKSEASDDVDGTAEFLRDLHTAEFWRYLPKDVNEPQLVLTSAGIQM